MARYSNLFLTLLVSTLTLTACDTVSGFITTKEQVIEHKAVTNIVDKNEDIQEAEGATVAGEDAVSATNATDNPCAGMKNCTVAQDGIADASLDPTP